MISDIFAIYAPKCWKSKYAAIPSQKDGKAPLIKNQYSFADNIPNAERQAEWLRKFFDANIAVVMGTKLADGTILGALDVDDDRYSAFVGAIIGYCPAIKKSPRGLTYFVRLPANFKKSVILGLNDKGVIDILGKSSYVIVPPSIHVNGTAYEWVGDKPLWECSHEELPYVGEQLDFMRKVIHLREHGYVLDGEMTNKPAVTIAQHTAHLIDKERWCAAISALLPITYQKNLKKELPGIYDWGLEHSHGDKFKPYDPGSEGPIPKGCTRDERFAFFDPRLQTVKVKTAKQLSQHAELLDLASRKFWKQFAPTEKGYGFDAMAIADMLIAECLSKGKLDVSRIRGVGGWRDKNGKFINNLYGPIPEQGWYIYTRFEEFPTLVGKEIKPQDLLKWLMLFNWKDPNFAIIVLGWLSYAPICGALKQRPHLYLTGAKNTGKTSLLMGIEAVLKPLVLTFDGSVTTEAGLRQKLGENAFPVIIDEFESSNPQRRERIMDLARSSYSANASGVKGTPSGKHMEFLISSTFLFSGIDFQRENAANASRVFVVELVKHNDDPEIERKIEEGQIQLEEQQTSWRLERVKQAETILEAINLFQLQLLKINSRAKKNMATYLGAAFVALEGKLPDKNNIQDWIKKYESLICSHEDGHAQNDAQDCLAHLLAYPLYYDQDEQRTVNVWELVAIAAEVPVMMLKDSNKGPLQAAGMRVENAMFYVADNHPALRKAYQGTRWERSGWKSQLLRLDGAIEDRTYFQGQQQRCVAIPLINLNLDHINSRLNEKHLIPKTRQNKNTMEGGRE